MENLEVVIAGMKRENKEFLIEKITESQIFEVKETGHIEVKRNMIKPDHPHCHGYFLPVGYIKEEDRMSSALLVNTHFRQLEDYHARLREIYGVMSFC